jgi:hypothetical protein
MNRDPGECFEKPASVNPFRSSISAPPSFPSEFVCGGFPCSDRTCDDSPSGWRDCAGERFVIYAKACIAGFLPTLVFRLLTLFWLPGAFPRAPYRFEPAGPLAVAAVISLAFWGSVWALVIWPLLRDAVGTSYWLRARVGFPLAADAAKQSGQVTRLSRRLQIHQPIAKIPRSRRWRVSRSGRRVMAAAITLRDVADPSLYAEAA